MHLVWFFTVSAMFSLILGEFGQYPFGTSSASISLTDVLLVISLGLLLIWQLETKTTEKLPKLLKLLGLFWIVGIVSLIVSGNLSGGLYLLRFVVYSSSLYLGYSLIRSKVTHIESIFTVLGYVGVLLSLLGFLQLFLFPDLQILYSFGYDPHINRLFSTFLDPNLVGSFLNLSLMSVLYLYLRSKRALTLVWIFIIGLAILLTFSRSAYLMMALGVLIFFWFYSRKMLILLVILGFVVVLVVPAVRERVWGAVTVDKSASERIKSWENGIVLIAQKPIFGVGFNNLRDLKKEQNLFDTDQSPDIHSGSGLDSSLLFVAATSGTLGLFAYLSFWVCFLRSVIRKLKSRDKLLSVCLLGLTFGIIVNSQFINSLFFTPVVFVLFLLIGGYIASTTDS